MSKLYNPEFIARQDAAEKREFQQVLDQIAIIENILGLPDSTGTYITYREALARLTNLQAQTAAALRNADPESEAGRFNPINLDDELLL